MRQTYAVRRQISLVVVSARRATEIIIGTGIPGSPLGKIHFIIIMIVMMVSMVRHGVLELTTENKEYELGRYNNYNHNLDLIYFVTTI